MDIEKRCLSKQQEEFQEINETCRDFITWKNNPLPIFQSGKQIKYPLNFTVTISIDDPIARAPAQFELECSVLKSYPVLAPLIKMGPSMFIGPQARKHLTDDMMDEIRKSKTEKMVLAAITFIRECQVGLKIAQEWFPKPNNNSNSNSSVVSKRWFLSHHIISQVKRHWVMEWAKELELTGFLISGTPGYLYIEGDESYHKCFIKRLLSFSWKSMDQVFFDGNANNRDCTQIIEFEGKPGLTEDTLKPFGLDVPFQKLFGIKK